MRIPFFREVLLESFSCDHCGHKNSSVKPAGAIQEKGSKFLFRLENEDDFQRQVVRTNSATFRVVDLDLETPASEGQLTTIESLISKILTDLEADQPARKEEDPQLYTALVGVIQKLMKMLNNSAFPFTISLDDPSGNSFIEPSPTDRYSKYTRTDYLRTHEQNVALGLVVEKEDGDDDAREAVDAMAGVNLVDGELYEIPAECPACSQACTVNMKKVTIPHFKEVVLMATVCEHCGYRTSDVKTGGEIPDKGQRITLMVKTIEDLSRDILKSETCALRSADLNLEVQPGTLGGRFTTVEGLLTQVRDQLRGQIFDTGTREEGLASGDSMMASTKEKWNAFFGKLDQALRAEIEFSIILEDPLANSYVQASSDDDVQIVKEDYERTEEEIEDLGLNDMKTEGYQEDDAATGHRTR